MDWNFIIFSAVKIAVVIGDGADHGGLLRAGRAQNFGVDSGPRRAEPHRAAVREIHSRRRPVADAARIFPAAGGRIEVSF